MTNRTERKKEKREFIKRICEVAITKLDLPPKILQTCYADEDFVPKPVRKLFKKFLQGQLTKEQTAKQLNKLANRSEWKSFLSALLKATNEKIFSFRFLASSHRRIRIARDR